MINNIHEPDPMAEIALALAMAFFSIMVLTMVSMGTSFNSESNITPKENIEVQASQTPADQSEQENTKTDSKPFILIFNKGQYLDVDLRNVSPDSVQNYDDIILAVMPELSITETIAAKKRVKTKNIKVTILDQRWINRLKEIE